MNAVRNNWKRRVRCRLLQRSHFLVPCKYCITETPAVSCRLGIPHNSEMSTLTENLSQDQIVTRAWTSLLWTEPVFDWFQIQLFVLVFFLEKTKLNQISSGVFSVFLFFFSLLLTSIRRGKMMSKESQPLLQVLLVWSATDGGPQGVLTRANHLLHL